MAEKGHPPQVGAGPAAGSIGYGRDPLRAAGSVGYGRDPLRVASGMGGTRRGKKRVGAGAAAGSPRRVPPIPAAGPAPTRGG